jgi:hypothetical protein
VVWLLLGGLLACQTGPGDSQDAPAAADQAEQGPSPVAVLASLIHQLGTPASPDPTEENQVAALEPAEGLNEGQPIKEGPETKNAPPEPPQEVAEGLEGPEAPAELESPAVPAAPPVLAPDLREPVAPKPFKRRRALGEEDLRKQLAWAPEVRSFTLDSMGSLLRAYRADFQVSRGDWNGVLEPVLLLQQRPDLANLPVRSGSASRLTPKAARTLQTLSQKLHAYVDRATSAPPDGRPDPTLLRDVLRWEKRGQRPEWLRPEAIPSLTQLLMHEATPIRLLLVEVLAEIDGKAATRALARRAVFDLAPEVREAAVRALADRPRSDVRPLLLQALRYPWAPAADHAAEALVALDDHEAVPALVSLLKKPDPNGLFPRTDGRSVVREVVRIDHRANCLMCHPPAIRGREPVPGMVPGVSLQLPESQFRMLAMCKETGRVVVNPLLVRADVTFLRQDFSVRQPTAPGVEPAKDLRFDYLVRTRPARAEEVARLRSRPSDPNGYEQRAAVLFALRELTGLDPGPTTTAWQQYFPRTELDAKAAR